MAILPNSITKKRPTAVLLTSFSLIFIPFIFVGILIYGHNKGFVINWRLQFSIALISFGFWIASFGVVKVKQWGYYVLFVIFAVTLAVDIQHILTIPNSFNLWDVVDFVVVAIGVVAFLVKRNRGVYFDPQMRWWDRAPRYKTDLVGEFTSGQEKFKLPLLLISKSGCFATYGDLDKRFEKGDTFNIKLKTGDVTFESKVRIITGKKDPNGYGMGFIEMNSDGKKNIKAIIKVVRPRFKLANQAAS